MTPSLPELQRRFADAVFDGTGEVLPYVRDGTFPAARQIQVYRNNTFANLTDALTACYPVVRRLVGDGFFDHLADSYIRGHPPRSGNLHDFGADLAEFLRGFPPAQSLVYLPDVARLEWCRQEAYHAADTRPLSFDALASVPPDRYATLVFELHPSARLFESPFPCLRIWQINQPGVGDDSTVDLDTGTQRALIVRRQLHIHMEELDIGEHTLLHALLAGSPLGESSHAALAADPIFDLASTLRRLVAGSVVTGIVDDID